MKYEAKIVERWSKVMTVEADSLIEAEQKAKEMYADETGNSTREGIAFDVDSKKEGMRVENIKELQ